MPSQQPANNTMPIAQTLNTKEGKEALAQALLEPIKIALEYQAIGRKLMMASQLPGGYIDWEIEAVRRVVDPILEMDDWIDEKYWPEWEIVFDDDKSYFVQAPNEEQARIFATSYHHQKENLIAIALDIVEGRIALSKAMVEPIKISQQYVIRDVHLAFEPVLEMDDWIDEKYWPEWEIVYGDGHKEFVRATSEEQAKDRAYEFSFKNIPSDSKAIVVQ